MLQHENCVYLAKFPPETNKYFYIVVILVLTCYSCEMCATKGHYSSWRGCNRIKTLKFRVEKVMLMP